MSHRFGNEGQLMARLGLICLLSCRESGKIETVVSNKLLLLYNLLRKLGLTGK